MSERERKHCELQQMSSETIRRLEKQLETYQIELQEEKKRESAEVKFICTHKLLNVHRNYFS